MARRKLLAIAHDPGGAQAMRPVLTALSQLAWLDLSIYAGRYAASIFNRSGLSFRSIETNIDGAVANKVTTDEAPHLLFTATSWNSNVEQQFRNQAESKRLPSLVLIDFWSNYGLRFRESAVPVSCMQDTVCVMDGPSKSELVSEGFCDERIIVVGQPHIETLFYGARSARPTGTNSRTILYLSQPDVHDDSRDELLSQLLKLTSVFNRAMSSGSTPTVRLVIKPHPKQTISHQLHRKLKSLATNDLTIDIMAPDSALPPLIDASDMVVGAATMALFESRSRGKVTYGIVPEEINQALKQALMDVGVHLISPGQDFPGVDLDVSSHWELPPAKYHSGATERMTTLIKDLLSR